MDIQVVFSQMLVLVMMMATGYSIFRLGIVESGAVSMLTRLVLNVTLPALILSSNLSDKEDMTCGALIWILLLFFGSYVIYALVGMLFVRILRVPRSQYGTYQCMILFGNVAFMGFPIITAVFGAEYLIYAVVGNTIFNLLVYSLGIVLMSGAGGTKLSPRLFLNTPMISSVIAVAFMLLHVRAPAAILDFLDTMGAMTTPLAMVIIGATIAAMPIGEMFREWRIYLYTVVKLLVMPAVVYLIVVVLLHVDGILGAELVILSCMPTATNTTMLAIEYGGDRQLVSKGIFFTTILSVVTIPLVALLVV